MIKYRLNFKYQPNEQWQCKSVRIIICSWCYIMLCYVSHTHLHPHPKMTVYGKQSRVLTWIESNRILQQNYGFTVVTASAFFIFFFYGKVVKLTTFTTISWNKRNRHQITNVKECRCANIFVVCVHFVVILSLLLTFTFYKQQTILIYRQ